MAAAEVKMLRPYKPPHLKQGKVAKWTPKKWQPMYEEMVALSCAGRSNKTISEQFGYTEQHISTILNCPKAKMVRREMLEFLRKSVESRMEERVKDLQDVALKRLTEVLTNDELFRVSPFAVVDRGIQVLKGTGVLRTEAAAGSGGINAKNAIFIGGEAADAIREGLKAADEARRLHAPQELENKTEVVLDATGT